MAPIAAVTLFRTLCIPASLHHPTINLLSPFSVAFTQPIDHPFLCNTKDGDRQEMIKGGGGGGGGGDRETERPIPNRRPIPSRQ
eukprot:scaffold13902_cov173-Amphora_coffeaeformis.AAC.1